MDIFPAKKAQDVRWEVVRTAEMDTYVLFMVHADTNTDTALTTTIPRAIAATTAAKVKGKIAGTG